jgi:hypothetical protein
MQTLISDLVKPPKGQTFALLHGGQLHKTRIRAIRRWVLGSKVRRHDSAARRDRTDLPDYSWES